LVVEDNRLIERDCEALKIDFERMPVGRTKTAKPNKSNSRPPIEEVGGEAAESPD
jgi:hypothetical protein